MLLDLQEVESPQVFESEICIIGAGAAGIAIAREFLDSHIKVFVVESGGLMNEGETQELAAGENVGTPYYPLELARFREFGGSTARWGGHCAPLDEMDFEHRPWVPHSGWPIRRRDLESYYQRAQPLFEIGPYDYRPQSWEGNGVRFLGFTPNTIVTRLWQISPETNFGVTYREPLRQSRNVTVMLHGNVTEIITDERAAQAEGVRAVTLDGKSATIKARFVILACGGIENPRMLLLTHKVETAGLGNRHDLVGRFFMEHPHISSAGARFRGSKKWLKSYKERKKHEVWFRAGICLSAAAQRAHGVLNYSGILVDRFIRDTASHREVSGYLSLKSIALNLRKGRVPRDINAHLRNVVTDFDAIAVGVYRHLLNQNPGVYTRSEQAPNPDSRVTLSGEKDRLGLNKVRLDWRLTALDKHTIRIAVDLCSQEFQRLGLGTVVPDDWLIADDTSWPASLKGGYHHMGTTRMSDDPKLGVVDAHCRVHGVSNLYIAGSSVFPTGGYANPTLTIVALGMRLADHLKERIGTHRTAYLGDAVSKRPQDPATGAHPSL